MPVNSSTLDELMNADVLSSLDLHFARAMARLVFEQDERVVLAAALVSRQVQAGHVCLDLPRLCGGQLVLEGAASVVAAWPALDVWLHALANSALVRAGTGMTPLCLDAAGRLYLRRYFEHQRGLADALLGRARRPSMPIDRGLLEEGLDRLFGPAKRGATPADPDLQRVAAQRAVERALCVVSGGPGTGKTTTVVKILALIIEQAIAAGRPLPRVHLMAPTGKAAARLTEAIRHAKAGLACAPSVRDAIGEDASTIHRALGSLGGQTQRFRHGRERPLATDVVVVDEASMVDLALMARLLDAIPERARVILLGDKNQLSSVEAGAVLGDICDAGIAVADVPRVEAPTKTERVATPQTHRSPIADCIVHLTHSHRYAPASGIRRLADAIQEADAERALALLLDATLPDVVLLPSAERGELSERLIADAVAGFEPFLDAHEPEPKLVALTKFRVLCAHRHGQFGQVAVNDAIETALRASGSISTQRGRYAGRPVLITQNDPRTRLWNGDVGVLLRDPAGQDRLRACFLGTNGLVRELSAARLPPHESVYAMSVHKSQGSEFDDVAVVLPADPSPVLSRELLYTAVTRARKRVVIYADPAIVAHAIRASVERASGLRDALWGP